MYLERLLINNAGKFGSITHDDLNTHRIFTFDFTMDNIDLAKINMNSADEFDTYVKQTLKSNNAGLGIGKYNEDRTIYRRSALFGTREEDLRTIHVGIDVILPKGTEILCPLDSIIHSFQNNSGFGDYGPTIILQHILDGVIFYTLYGHLSVESLEGKSEGQHIRRGEWIGDIGNTRVNGNWFEHLHFQIIADIQGKKGDFWAVVNHRDREKYLKICPDPNLILGIKALRS